MTYRAHIRITAADDGRPLGAVGLGPVAANLQAHINEAFAEVERQGYRRGYAAVWVASRLGQPCIRFEAAEAWEVRVAWKAIDRFLKATGWTFQRGLNANTSRAL